MTTHATIQRPTRLDSVSSVIAHNITLLSQVSEAQRYEILRRMISSLSNPDTLYNICDEKVLSKCYQILRDQNSDAVTEITGQINIQISNIRSLSRTINKLQDPSIPLEKISFQMMDLTSNEKKSFNIRSLASENFHNLNAERVRQAKTGWPDLALFIRHVFTAVPNADTSEPMMTLADRIAREQFQRNLSGQWLWGLFVCNNEGTAERLTVTIIENGNSETDFVATRPDDTVEGKKVRSSIEQARYAASKYLKTLSIPDLHDTFDIKIKIGEQYIPEGYQGASLGLPVAILIVANLLQIPIDQKTALTGEIDSQGHILPVDGVEEKVRAAITRGIEQVIVPIVNVSGVVKAVDEKTTVRGVSSFDEACDLLFTETLIARGYKPSLLFEASQPDMSDAQVILPLVGRSAELSWLQQRINLALSGRGTLSLITGEAGIGKSRLLEESQTYAQSIGMHVMCGHCLYQQDIIPYRPIIGVLKSINLSNDQIWSGYLERLNALLDDKGGEYNPEHSQSTLHQMRLFELIQTMLDHIADGQGLLLCIEDIHWADSVTLQFLYHLIRGIGRKRFCVILTYRIEERQRGSDLADTLQRFTREKTGELLELGNLSKEAVRKILDKTLDSRIMSTWLCDRVQEETGGNPLFVSEILKWWNETGVLKGITSKQMIFNETAFPIPPHIYDLIAHRVEHIQTEDREILEVAAVGGDRFDVEGVIACSTEDRLTILKRLHLLERKHNLVSYIDGTMYRFHHPKIQEVLYHNLSPPLRQAYHSAWAQYLLTDIEEGREVSDEIIASHLYKGGDEKSAIPYLKRAGIRLLSIGAHHEALKCWGQLEEILIKKCIPEDSEDRITANHRLGQICITIGKLNQATERYERFLTIVKSHPNKRFKARALLGLASILRAKNKWIDAIKLFERAKDIYSQIDDLHGVGISYAHIGLVSYSRGQWKQAKINYKRAMKIAAEYMDEIEIASTTLNLGVVLFNQGDYKTALVYLEKSEVGFKECGFMIGMALVDCNTGMIYERMENWKAALERYQKSIERFECTGHVRHLSNAYLNYARVLARTGSLESAIVYSEKSKEFLKEHEDKICLAETKRVEGLIASLENKWSKAEEYFNHSIKICTDAEDPNGLGETYMGMGGDATSTREERSSGEKIQKGLEFISKNRLTW